MDQVLTVSCKLQVPPKVAREIDVTLAAFAGACEFVNTHTPAIIHNNVALHHLVYHELRARFGLSANLAVRAIARVAANRKAAKAKDQGVKLFRPTSADYDARIFSFREQDWTVSLTLLGGRRKFNLLIGNYQRGLLKGQQPTSATLVTRRTGDYYLQIQVKYTPPAATKGTKVVGLDLGRVDIVHTSEGDAFSGEQVNQLRDKFAKVRASAQHTASKGTRSSRRRCRELLQRLSGRERRFQAWLNHTISFRLVQTAKSGGYSLALEDLSGIRERVKAKGPMQRRKAHSWAFFQLRQFLVYKALQAGVELLLVDPAYTSKSCHCCLHLGQRTGKVFACANCGWQGDADLNGAKNIAALGLIVTQPGGPGLYCVLHDSVPGFLKAPPFRVK